MILDNFNELVGEGIDIYGSREKIRSQVIDYAKTYLQLETVDFYKTSVMSYIADTLSILAANQLFYDSVIYREFFMVDAQMQESVYNLVQWVGFEVPKAKASTVDVMFTIPLSFSQDQTVFSIPNNFKAYAGEIVYTINSIADVALDSPTSNVSAAQINFNKTLLQANISSGKVVQGEIINNSALTIKDSSGFYRPIYLSTDGKYASFTLPFTQHEKQYNQFLVSSNLQQYQFFSKVLTYAGMISNVRVWVAEPPAGEKLILNNTDVSKFDPSINVETNKGKSIVWIEWTESSNGIYTMAPGTTQFVFVSGINQGELFFGNGIIGKQPAANSAITVQLDVTQGSNGEVVPYGITKGDSISYNLVDTYGNPQSRTYNIVYQIANPVQSQGGEDTPTLPEIKRQAIINLRSKERLVSELDYDNINTILKSDFPVIEGYPILKRSDLKVNEILTFASLLYHDELYLPQIVPTRNVTFSVYDPTFILDKYTILRTSQVMVDNEYYQTLFNITIHSDTMMAYYDYMIQNLVGTPVTLYEEGAYSWYQQYTYIPMNTIDYTVVIPDTTSTSSSSSSNSNQSIYPLRVRVNVNHIPTNNPEDYQFNKDNIPGTEIRCTMVTKWGNLTEYEQTYVNWVLATERPKYNYFEFEIPNYIDVPTEVQRFEFTLWGYGFLRDPAGYFVNEQGQHLIDPVTQLPTTDVNAIVPVEGWIKLSQYYSDVMVRKDLTDVMFSTVTRTSLWDGVFHPGSTKYDVHNVPAILSSYLDDGQGGGILNRADNKTYPNFEVTVMQALIKNLDLSGTRMLTDSVNVKFPDTHGILNNLKYNPIDDTVRSRFHTPFKWENPEDILFTADSPVSSSSATYTEGTVKYIVNGEVDSYSYLPLANYINYIAEAYIIGNTVVWYLTAPKRGMYVKVKDELDSAGDEKIVAYDGDGWIDVQSFSIPLKLKFKVELDPSVNVSGNTLKQTIKDTLINAFSPYMGTQKPFDRSSVLTVVRKIPGVQYVEILSPGIDITFNYNIEKDLTQPQLLDYTPQYVGFTQDSIEIDIKT